MRENYEKSERISAGECLHTALDTHTPPQALTTSTPQLTFHTHTQIYAGRKQPLLSALKMQCPVQRPTTYPAVTASPHRGKAAAQPGSAACYTHQPLSEPPKDSDTVPPSHQPRAPLKGGGLPVSSSVALTCKTLQLLTTQSALKKKKVLKM